MSENYIVINGKRTELTQEQLEALGIEPKAEKKNPFDTLSHGKEYCFIADGGYIDYATEHGDTTDNLRFECANYCTDSDILQQQAYRETLNRLLWRFSMKHDGDKIDWTNDNTNKHNIFYDHSDKTWTISCNQYCQWCAGAYFNSYEIAEQAIEEVVKPFMASHPDFKL